MLRYHGEHRVRVDTSRIPDFPDPRHKEIIYNIGRTSAFWIGQLLGQLRTAYASGFGNILPYAQVVWDSSYRFARSLAIQGLLVDMYLLGTVMMCLVLV